MRQDTTGINADGHARAGKTAHSWDWSGELTDGTAAQAAAPSVQPAPVPAPPLLPGPLGWPTPPPAPAAPAAAPPPASTDAAAPAAIANVAVTPAYPALYVFGGSLCDVGNEFAEDGGTQPVAPNYEGTYSNGPLWIEDYAADMGMAAPMPSLLGGTDFAYAGAQTGAPDLGGTGFDLPEQYAEFTQQVPDPTPGALYVIDFGVNDLDAILRTGASIPQMESAVTESVQTEIAYIGALAALGATNFLVLNVPDFGVTPKEIDAGPTAQAEATNLSIDYNSQLSALLVPAAVGDHVNVDLIDTFSLVDSIVANPTAYGFDNVTTPVWDGNDTNPNSGTLAATTPEAQDKYFFWDMMHPTASGQALIAAAAENLTFG